MKFKVSFKDPDTLHDAIDDAVRAEVAAMGLPEDEAEELIEIRREKVQAKVSKWFPYSEYVDLEVDTESDTVLVLKRP